MSTPYRTPRVPDPPHPTPLSAAQNLSGSKLSRPPIQNPYDKFPQADFDNWINGITGALKQALGQAELEPQPLLKQRSSQWTSSQVGHAKLRYPSAGMHEDDEDVGNETFAEIKARRLGKGKARDPREGPGLQNGHRHEPIEIVSSDEEDIDEVAQSIRIDEDEEEEETVESIHAERDDILGEVREYSMRPEAEFEDDEARGSDDEEADEHDEDVEVDEQNGYKRAAPTQVEDERYFDHENEDDHSSDEIHIERDEHLHHASGSRTSVLSQASRSHLWNDDGEQQWDAEDDEGQDSFEEEDEAVPIPQDNEGSPEIIEIISDDDEPQQDTSPRNLSNIGPQTKSVSTQYGKQHDKSQDKWLVPSYTDGGDWEEEELDELEGDDHEVMEDEYYDEEEVEDGDGDSHRPPVSGDHKTLEGAQQDQYLSQGGDLELPASVSRRQEHEVRMLNAHEDAEEQNPEDPQPDDNDTSFPPRSSREGDNHVGIRDPWEGAKYYAEDLYTGGDNIAPGSDPHHMGTIDDEAVMDAEELNRQPAHRNTAFPPQDSTPERTIEIPDQWTPVATFAEDIFSGGIVQPSEVPVDPSLLTGSADSVDAQHQYHSAQSVQQTQSDLDIIASDEFDGEHDVQQDSEVRHITPEDDDDIPVIHVDMGDGASDASEANHNFTIIPPTPLMSSALSDFDPASEDDLFSTFDINVSQNAMLFSAHAFAGSFLGTGHLQQAVMDSESIPAEFHATIEGEGRTTSPQLNQPIEEEKGDSMDNSVSTNAPVDGDEDDVEEVVFVDQNQDVLEQNASDAKSTLMSDLDTSHMSIERVESTEEIKSVEPRVDAPTEQSSMAHEVQVLNGFERDTMPAEVSTGMSVVHGDTAHPILDTQFSEGLAAVIAPEYEQLPTPPSESYATTIQKPSVGVDEVSDTKAENAQPGRIETFASQSVHHTEILEYTVSEVDEEHIDDHDNDDAEGEDDNVEILSILSSSDLGMGMEDPAYEVEEPITEGRLTEEPSSGPNQDVELDLQTAGEFTDLNKDTNISTGLHEEDPTNPPREEASASVNQDYDINDVADSNVSRLVDHAKYDPSLELPRDDIADLFTPDNTYAPVAPALDDAPSSTDPQDNTTESVGLSLEVPPPSTNSSESLLPHRQPSTSAFTMPLTRKSTDPILVADPFPASLSTPGIPLIPANNINDGDDDVVGNRSLNSELTIDKELDFEDFDFQYPPSPVVPVNERSILPDQPGAPELGVGTLSLSSLVHDKEVQDEVKPHLEVQKPYIFSADDPGVTPPHVPVREPKNQEVSFNETPPPNTLKRKRDTSNTTKESATVKQKGRKPRGKPRKSLSILSSPEKIEGDVIVVKPRPKTKPPVDQSRTPAKPSSSGTSISQKPDSFASSIDSSARSERSLIMQVSPTVDKPHLSTRLSPAPIVNLFHAHGQKRKVNYAPSNTSRSNPPPAIPLLVDKPTSNLIDSRINTAGPSLSMNLSPTPTLAPSASVSIPTPSVPQHSPPSLSQTSPSAMPDIPILDPVHHLPETIPSSLTKKPARSSPDVSAVTPAKHAAHAPMPPSSHTPVTRSHCRYHRISLPKSDDEGSPRVFFLVPGCSLTHPDLMREEEIEDHGEATQDDGARMRRDIDSYNFDSTLIGVLRQLVGLDILREQEVFYLPSPGDGVITRKHPPLKTFSEKTAMIRAGEGSNHSGSPGHSASPRPPVSVANSVSTTRSFYHKRRESDRGSITPSIQSDSNDDVEEGPSKRIRSSPADVDQEVGSMGPPKLKVKKARRSTRIDATYDPDEDVHDEDEGDKPVGKRKRKHKKRGVKRTRTADALDEDKPSRKPKKLKTHATMPPSFAMSPASQPLDQPPVSQS